MPSLILYLHRGLLPAGVRVRPSFSALYAPYESRTEILLIYLPKFARLQGEFLLFPLEAYTPRMVLESVELGSGRFLISSSTSQDNPSPNALDFAS